MWSPTNFSRFCNEKSWHCLGISRGNRFQQGGGISEKLGSAHLSQKGGRDPRPRTSIGMGAAARVVLPFTRQGEAKRCRNGSECCGVGSRDSSSRNMSVTRREAINIESGSCIDAQLGSASIRPSAFMSLNAFALPLTPPVRRRSRSHPLCAAAG
jgi:hypothetical protein